MRNTFLMKTQPRGYKTWDQLGRPIWRRVLSVPVPSSIFFIKIVLFFSSCARSRLSRICQFGLDLTPVQNMQQYIWSCRRVRTWILTGYYQKEILLKIYKYVWLLNRTYFRERENLMNSGVCVCVCVCVIHLVEKFLLKSCVLYVCVKKRERSIYTSKPNKTNLQKKSAVFYVCLFHLLNCTTAEELKKQ